MGCIEHTELLSSLQMFFSVMKSPVFANWNPINQLANSTFPGDWQAGAPSL